MSDTNLEVTFRVQHCVNTQCGIAFAMTAMEDDDRLRDHQPFYCPRGHKQCYTGQSDIEKARSETKRAEERALAAQARENEARHALEVQKRQTAVQKGQRTRLLKRITAGLCPCCNRTFANLANHIAGKHPEAMIEAGHTQRQLAHGNAGSAPH